MMKLACCALFVALGMGLFALPEIELDITAIPNGRSLQEGQAKEGTLTAKPNRVIVAENVTITAEEVPGFSGKAIVFSDQSDKGSGAVWFNLNASVSPAESGVWQAEFDFQILEAKTGNIFFNVRNLERKSVALLLIGSTTNAGTLIMNDKKSADSIALNSGKPTHIKITYDLNHWNCTLQVGDKPPVTAPMSNESGKTLLSIGLVTSDQAICKFAIADFSFRQLK